MSEELEKVCETLDKLTLDALTLMEEQIQLKLSLENAMVAGESNLAKTRYILGQNSVSVLQLPSEDAEMTANVKVVDKSEKYLDCKAVEIQKCGGEDVPNPLKWFGVLVPQNLHNAQKMFTQAINYVVDSVNVQRKLEETCVKLKQLKEYKKELLG
ncbi:unnamed protein product [Brassicogethes aeneus]|uniref:Vacuolar ATPase assembly protein VMA22 n=1 Tax=Brassicogethes aeneus TaxID=1431903 RepID=A0A9P0BHV4_BRAAE|nr:unnamed protein product [Brassicogethes aeneus]